MLVLLKELSLGVSRGHGHDDVRGALLVFPWSPYHVKICPVLGFEFNRAYPDAACLGCTDAVSFSRR